MLLHKLITQSRHRLRCSRLLQIGLVIAFWEMGTAFADWTGLPIPGGIFGMVLLLVLLASGRASQASFRLGANWFVTEMLLFFIPAVLSVLNHRELLGMLGLKIFLLIVLSTLMVMGATAFVVDLGFRTTSHRQGESHAMD